MPEITDEMIKKKHKEFNERVRVALSKKSGNMGVGFSPEIQQLRQAVRQRKLPFSAS